MTKTTGAAGKAAKQAADATPGGGLSHALSTFAGVLADKAVSSVTDAVSRSAQRLTDYAEGNGDGGLKTALTGATKLAEGKNPASALLSTGASRLTEGVKGALGGGDSDGQGDGKSGGKSAKGGGLKLTNIVESIDVGVPLELAYDQWTRFTDFPAFMKKVEHVEQESDEKLTWKAQILWSHRSWESTITDQVPDEHIAWRSRGQKGSVDGVVTFHELAPRLTRILVVLEYHPQGFFEQTGNLWRAQGRRVRLELKHFRRQVMTQTLLHPDETEGWHGTIHDGEVVEDGDPERAQPAEEPQSDEDRTDDSGEDYGDYEDEEDEEDEEGGDREEAETEQAAGEGDAEDSRAAPARRPSQSRSRDRGERHSRRGRGGRA